MPRPALFQKLVHVALQFVTFLGTAAWCVYWLTMRVPSADWRYLAVGLMLAGVLGWWPLISLGVTVALSVAVGFAANELDGETKVQVIEEIAIFWALGLGWGVLAKAWLAVPAARNRSSAAKAPYNTATSAVHHAPSTPLKTAEDSVFRSRRLMAGGGSEEINRSPVPAPAATRGATPAATAAAKPELPKAPSGLAFPVFKDPNSDMEVVASADAPKPPPRPVLAPPSYDAGGESVFGANMPGLQNKESSHLFVDTLAQETTEAPAMKYEISEASEHPVPIQPHPGAQTAELRLDSMPPLPPVLEEPSVVPAAEFPTMELPVNTLLRSVPRASHNPNSSFHIPVSSSSGSTGSAGDASESDAQTIRRSSSFLRPETEPGSPYEHVLEWYNQFSWSPWSSEELERRYHRPGVQVGWTSMALADLAKAWKVWQAGPVPSPASPGQVSLGALEGFLRCEMLGVLRHQGFPDLHMLSASTEGDTWIPVYHEVRGRFRGGDAIIHRPDRSILATDAKDILVGVPDRFAEVRGESDVVALVTPFSVGESLNWTTVYAVAQQRVAETMGQNLSGVPVVINLPLPIWDERRQPRVVVVEDVATEQRRLEASLERFNKLLSGLVPPKPQVQASVCNGCGWRHFCAHYAGGRPRLELSKPPAQIAAALR